MAAFSAIDSPASFPIESSQLDYKPGPSASRTVRQAARSLLHIHGEADKNVPIDGGEGPDSLAGVNFTSPRAAVQTFPISNGCSSEPEVAGGADNADLTISTWAGCDGGAKVQFVAVAGAAHSWMGHVPSDPAVLPAYQGLDASYEIVAFLLAQPRASG